MCHYYVETLKYPVALLKLHLEFDSYYKGPYHSFLNFSQACLQLILLTIHVGILCRLRSKLPIF